MDQLSDTLVRTIRVELQDKAKMYVNRRLLTTIISSVAWLCNTVLQIKYTAYRGKHLEIKYLLDMQVLNVMQDAETG